MNAKRTLREALWRALKESGDARFPGTKGRIPNFTGAEAAAARLAETDVFERARVLKCNPDSPQRPVRHLALKAGKTVIMAVPKLADRACFIRLDPSSIDDPWRASSIKGASALGERIHEHEVGPIDLIVTGCVGVGSEGARLGKGGGYSDLEYGILRELGLVDADTPIVSTVHPTQLLPAGAVPVEPHDISLDLVCTPSRTLSLRRSLERPEGVDWSALSDDDIDAIPVLAERRPRS